MSGYIILRWLHIIAGTAWFGEVVTINFVLIPALLKMSRPDAADFLNQVFPRIFKLASVLAATTVTCGLAMGIERFGANPSVLWTTSSGLAFLVGGSLGLLLTTFHFVLEPRLDGMICLAAEQRDFEVSDRVVRMLKIVPRAGLGVITAILMLMMVGARGI